MSIQSLCSLAWEGTKSLLQKVEPYQPALAACVIVGKCSWNLYRHHRVTKEAKDLASRVRIVKCIATDPKFLKNAAVRRRIQILESNLSEKKNNINLMQLSWGQLPSLICPHPGSNLWNSSYQIVQRSVQLHQTGKDPLHLETIASIGGGAIAIVGTATSFLRQIGAIDPNHPAGHALIGLATVVSVIEGIWLAKNYLKSLWNYRPQEINPVL